MADLIDRDALGVSLFPLGKKDAADIYKIIMEQPAVNRWIPCSERLPEKQCRCLVTTESGQVETRTFLFSLTQGAPPYFSGWEKVIAWMPAPDAYEPL